MTIEKERAHRDHCSLSTTKIIMITLVSVPLDGVAKQRSAELRHEGQGGRRVTEHEDSVYASLTQSKEEIAFMEISDAEAGRWSVRSIRVAIGCIRKLEGPHGIASLIGSSTGAQEVDYSRDRSTSVVKSQTDLCSRRRMSGRMTVHGSCRTLKL